MAAAWKKKLSAKTHRALAVIHPSHRENGNGIVCGCWFHVSGSDHVSDHVSGHVTHHLRVSGHVTHHLRVSGHDLSEWSRHS